MDTDRTTDETSNRNTNGVTEEYRNQRLHRFILVHCALLLLYTYVFSQTWGYIDNHIDFGMSGLTAPLIETEILNIGLGRKSFGMSLKMAEEFGLLRKDRSLVSLMPLYFHFLIKKGSIFFGGSLWGCILRSSNPVQASFSYPYNWIKKAKYINLGFIYTHPIQNFLWIDIRLGRVQPFDERGFFYLVMGIGVGNKRVHSINLEGGSYD